MTKKNDLVQNETPAGGSSLAKHVSRRGFLKLSGISAFSVAGLTVLTACGPSTDTSDDTSTSAATTSASSSDFGSDGKMRVGMEVAYPPYNWQVSEESEFTIPVEGQDDAFADGFDVVVAKKVAAEFDLEPVASKLAWSGLIEALTAGQIDCIIAGMTPTPEREESIDFSDPYFTGTYGLLVRKDGNFTEATSLDDFAGAAVLGQKDTLLDEAIDEIPDVNHLSPVDSVPAQLSHLNNGACDAITYNVENREGLLAANPDLMAIQTEDGDYTLFSVEAPCNVGLPKGKDEVLDRINDVLAAYPDDERQEDWNAVLERQPA